MALASFQNSRPECNIENFYTAGTHRKIDCFSVDGFCSHCNTIFEALGCFYYFCECQEGQLCLTDEDIVKGQRKREMDELRRFYLREKNYPIIEMWECQWKLHMRENHEIMSFVRSTFPYKRPLSFENLLSRIRKGELFGYVQCDLGVPENLREKFESFPPIFKKNIPFTLRHWRLHEKIRRGKQTDDSTPENVNFQFSSHKRYNYHTAFKLLFGSWIRMCPNLSFCSVHSNEMF